MESGLQQHQLVKYAIQSGVLNASRTGSVDERALTDIAGQAADAMSVNLSLAQSGESALYSNLADGLSAAAGTDGGIGYQILERTVGSGVHSDWLVMTSTFQQSGYALELTTARSMSAVFAEAELLRQPGAMWIFLGGHAGRCAAHPAVLLAAYPAHQAPGAFQSGVCRGRLQCPASGALPG